MSPSPGALEATRRILGPPTASKLHHDILRSQGLPPIASLCERVGPDDLDLSHLTMVLRGYFKTNAAQPEPTGKSRHAPHHSESSRKEKPDSIGQDETTNESGRSSPNLSRPRSRASFPSQASSMADIRHEVMVNYIFQQQCEYLQLYHRRVLVSSRRDSPLINKLTLPVG